MIFLKKVFFTKKDEAANDYTQLVLEGHPTGGESSKTDRVNISYTLTL